MKQITKAERADMMLNQPIRSVIPRLAIPTIISMLISNIYNMADTYFVGQIGTSASGAVGVIFSAMSVIQAVAFTIGMGSGANMSRALGAGKQEEAAQYVSLAFFASLFTGIVLGAAGLLSVDWMVRFLGATETIAPHATAYATYIFYAAPFMMASLAMNNLLRFQGLASYGMVGITTGGILNIALDPVFIFVLDLGTAGAAIATAISQFVSFVILLVMINTREDAISISWKNFKPTRRTVGLMLYNGMPSLGRQGIASVSTILLNNTARAWGDPAIAAMSIVSRLIMFINSSVIGFGQGFQPVCAFCYGAKRYRRVREAFFFSVKVTTVLLLCLGAIAALFAMPIVSLFRDDPAVIEIGSLALRLQLLTIPLWGFMVMSNMCTQSIGYGVRSTILSIARQGIFLIPALLILPPLFGLLGLQMAQPVSDVLSFLLCLLMMRRILSELKSLPDGTNPADK